MSLRTHFYYDSESCEFIPVEHNRYDLVIYTTALWILNGLILGAAGLSILSHYIGTPAELALKSENQALHEQFQQTRNTLEQLESEIAAISKKDNEMYRSVLGLESAPELNGFGIGGADPYSEFDIYSEETSELLRWTAGKLDNLERQVNIQRVSFDEIQSYYNNNREHLSHLPAIKPINSAILSGFGMRLHPVLRYNRMHEGLDFRADIGTPIYAAGDATVKMSGRRGSYGQLIVLDHGNGYETRYAHLSKFEDGIRPGKEVKRGDLIGYTGNTGMTRGPHLHYEVRVDGKAMDPLNFLISDTTPEEYQMYQDIAKNNPMSMD